METIPIVPLGSENYEARFNKLVGSSPTCIAHILTVGFRQVELYNKLQIMQRELENDNSYVRKEVLKVEGYDLQLQTYLNLLTRDGLDLTGKLETLKKSELNLEKLMQEGKNSKQQFCKIIKNENAARPRTFMFVLPGPAKIENKFEVKLAMLGTMQSDLSLLSFEIIAKLGISSYNHYITANQEITPVWVMPTEVLFNICILGVGGLTMKKTQTLTEQYKEGQIQLEKAGACINTIIKLRKPTSIWIQSEMRRLMKDSINLLPVNQPAAIEV